MSRWIPLGVVVLALGWASAAWGGTSSVPPEAELRTGAPVAVYLVGGQRLEGSFLGSQAGLVRIATGEGIREVPLALVEQAVWAGEALSGDTFRQATDRWAADNLPTDERRPSPVVAGALSAAWAGAGYLALGEPRSFAGWSALEGAVLGTGLLMWVQVGPGATAPFVALDLLLHGVAVQDVAGEAARRRRRVAVGLAPGEDGLPRIVATLGARPLPASAGAPWIEAPGMGSRP